MLGDISQTWPINYYHESLAWIQRGECECVIHYVNNCCESNLVGFSPCFNEGERLNGLQRGDARFVDIIHTNAGVLGIKESRGDVDFYPNGYIYQLFPIQLCHKRDNANKNEIFLLPGNTHFNRAAGQSCALIADLTFILRSPCMRSRATISLERSATH